MIRTEYGAQLANKVVYLKDFLPSTVRAFVTEYGNGLCLVSRQWVGDTHGAWELTA